MSFKSENKIKTKQQNGADTMLRDSNSLLTTVYSAFFDSLSFSLNVISCTHFRVAPFCIRRYILLFNVHRCMVRLLDCVFTFGIFFIFIEKKATTNNTHELRTI